MEGQWAGVPAGVSGAAKRRGLTSGLVVSCFVMFSWVRASRGAGVTWQWTHCPAVTARCVGRAPCLTSSYTLVTAAPVRANTTLLSPSGYISRLPPPVDAADVEPVLRALQSAQRPVIYYGGGCLDARDELREFAERTGIPLASTFMGLGVVPADHPNVSV